MSVGRRPTGVGEGFAARHRLLLVLLWAQVPALAFVALAVGRSMAQATLIALTLVVLAWAGMVLRSPSLAAVTVSVGLLATSAALAYNVGGHPISYFHLVLMVCAISFYRRWLPLAVAVVAPSTYLIVSAVVSGESATTAILQSDGILALALLLVVGWRIETEASPGPEMSADRFRLSFEGAPIGMAVLKPSGEFLEVNPAIAEILGYSPTSLVGLNINGLVHADDQEDLGEAWEQIGNSPTHRAAEWMRFLTATGQPIWARLSLSLLPRTEDVPAMVILQLQDATHTYEEQRRLESLLRSKDEFVATVGNEIREPLSLLIDLTDFAEHAHVDFRQSLPMIESHAKEVASIVDDLVVSARAETTPVSVVSHFVDVEVLCRDVLARIPGTGQVSLEFSAPYLWGDPALTRQIVNNLVLNAVHYGGPNVSLRTLQSGPDTVIQVFDDGPEIPPAERERIFNGGLGDGEPVTRPAAVGLRLTVGRQLARMMEGDLVYRRTANGENLFELRLPSEEITKMPRRRASMRGMGIPS